MKCILRESVVIAALVESPLPLLEFIGSFRGQVIFIVNTYTVDVGRDFEWNPVLHVYGKGWLAQCQENVTMRPNLRLVIRLIRPD